MYQQIKDMELLKFCDLHGERRLEDTHTHPFWQTHNLLCRGITAGIGNWEALLLWDGGRVAGGGGGGVGWDRKHIEL